MFSEQYRNDMDEQRLSDEACDRILDTLHREAAAPKRQPWVWRTVAVAAAVALLVTAMVPFLKEKPPTVSFYPEREDTPPVTVHSEKHLSYQEAFTLIDQIQIAYRDVVENEIAPGTQGDVTIKNELTDDRGEDTTTNTQYMDVDEADIVKVQNGYIFVLNRVENRLSVYCADGEKTTLCATRKPTAEARAYLHGMYLTPSRLVVVYTCHDVMRGVTTAGNQKWYLSYRTVAAVYDITDPKSPRYLTAYGQDGDLLDSRMVDGVLYLVSGHTVWDADKTDPASFVPALYRDGSAAPVAESALSAVPAPDAANYAVITAVSTWDDTARVSEKAVLGAGNARVWANSEHLMLLLDGTRRDVVDTPLENGNTYRAISRVATTTLHLFGINGGDVHQAAVATLDGTLYGQFAVDEWNGHFRVATTCGYSRSEREITLDEENKVMSQSYLNSEHTQHNRLYVLDGTLHEVGRIDDMAPDETVQSVRFDGEIGYIVTFRQTDPLFAIDLSDPQNPTVLSALKITGFSEYLHTFREDRLFGFGHAGTENGLNGQMKLTMFNTTDKTDITALHTLELPAEYVSSEALDNHHAILVDTTRSLVGFPVYTAGAKLTYVLYRYSDTDGFTPLARCEAENTEKSEALRGVFIGDYFYVVSPDGVTVFDTAFSPVATL